MSERVDEVLFLNFPHDSNSFRSFIHKQCSTEKETTMEGKKERINQ